MHFSHLLLNPQIERVSNVTMISLLKYPYNYVLYFSQSLFLSPPNPFVHHVSPFIILTPTQVHHVSPLYNTHPHSGPQTVPLCGRAALLAPSRTTVALSPLTQVRVTYRSQTGYIQVTDRLHTGHIQVTYIQNSDPQHTLNMGPYS